MRTWKMVAAAAVMLMIGGTVWYALNNNSDKSTPAAMAVNEPSQNKALATEPNVPAGQQSAATETGVASAKTAA
ncbi:MAG: hypothetical protein EOO19_04785, partial [Chryseobacterium sp.]